MLSAILPLDFLAGPVFSPSRLNFVFSFSIGLHFHDPSSDGLAILTLK
jgi:hypothetical protein